jgi:hypothetical protein
MFRNLLSLSCLAIAGLIVFPSCSHAQCMSYPVSLQERVSNAQSVLLGSVVSRHCYTDEKGNIYTLNKVEVDAWIKNHNSATEAYVITLGGVLGNKAQISYPAIQLAQGERYFFVLENDNAAIDDNSTRNSDPGKIQAMPYADAQGAWLYQEGKYHDVFTEGALTETALLQRLAAIGNLVAKRPDGYAYTPKVFTGKNSGTADINTFSPNPTDAGTVDPSDYLTISGSGFGTSPGTVSFPNADNGGASQITPPNASDYVTWTDNTIVVKVPTGSSNNAGTGFFTVNGLFTSPTPLTIRYSHISINSDFSGFGTPTRQRYYLRNIDGLGGYTFVYNTSFSANAAAVASFERVLNTWKCNTGINWRASGTTFSAYADDNENVVLFDASLPAGVLARATSRFSGAATGACNLQNTVWWLEEIDVQARPDGSGVTWQFGPALATGSQYDFETVVLHESGHAHGLGHRIAPGQLMNYALANAVNIRTPSAEEKQGGLDKMAYSTTPTCFNPTNSGGPMIAASCVTPVKLINFTGELKKAGTELNWQTQNEVSADKFDVQRSVNNTADFVTIGSVKAKGNTATETAYQFMDAGVRQGINYYRLKITDKDGSFEYSPIVSVKLSKAITPVSIYPNPVRNELVVMSALKTNVQLIDANGKVVRMLQLNAGNNTFDVSSLSNGLYYLSEKQTSTQIKVMVMH